MGSLKSTEIREMDVAVRRTGEKNLTEVCSLHLRVTIASVFRACCDFKKKNYGGVVLGNEAQELGTVCSLSLGRFSLSWGAM